DRARRRLSPGIDQRVRRPRRVRAGRRRRAGDRVGGRGPGCSSVGRPHGRVRYRAGSGANPPIRSLGIVEGPRPPPGGRMKLLAIETATPGSSVALAEGRKVVAYTSLVSRTGHSRFLVPAIDFCFDQVGWSPEDIDGVAVDIGPGLYTGMRVGIATAQALGATLGIPVVPVSSLDALAFDAASRLHHNWSFVDVTRGVLAVAAFRS